MLGKHQIKVNAQNKPTLNTHTCIYIHIQIHTYTYIYTHTHTYTPTHTHTHTHIGYITKTLSFSRFQVEFGCNTSFHESFTCTVQTTSGVMPADFDDHGPPLIFCSVLHTVYNFIWCCCFFLNSFSLTIWMFHSLPFPASLGVDFSSCHLMF